MSDGPMWCRMCNLGFASHQKAGAHAGAVHGLNLKFSIQQGFIEAVDALVTATCVQCHNEFTIPEYVEEYAEPKLCSKECAEAWSN